MVLAGRTTRCCGHTLDDDETHVIGSAGQGNRKRRPGTAAFPSIGKDRPPSVSSDLSRVNRARTGTDLSTSKPKNPGRVAGGIMGARRRWGPQRVVRLDDLTPEQRRLVLALVAAARENADADRAAA